MRRPPQAPCHADRASRQAGRAREHARRGTTSAPEGRLPVLGCGECHAKGVPLQPPLPPSYTASLAPPGSAQRLRTPHSGGNAHGSGRLATAARGVGAAAVAAALGLGLLASGRRWSAVVAPALFGARRGKGAGAGPAAAPLLLSRGTGATVARQAQQQQGAWRADERRSPFLLLNRL